RVMRSCRRFRRPPRLTSTPLPYTTLFRSHGRKTRAPDTEVSVGTAQPEEQLQVAPRAKIGRTDARHAAGPFHHFAVIVAHGQAPDRKSTRLNSSHVATSYAVFCLKKKKQN